LFRIADEKQDRSLCRRTAQSQHLHDGALDHVGILQLIDQQEIDLAANRRSGIWMAFEHCVYVVQQGGVGRDASHVQVSVCIRQQRSEGAPSQIQQPGVQVSPLVQ
jgi:hypothetical protein